MSFPLQSVTLMRVDRAFPSALVRVRQRQKRTRSAQWSIAHACSVVAVAASGHLRLVASSSASGLILLHHLASGELLHQFPALAKHATLLALSPLQPALVAYVPHEQRLYAWHILGHQLASAAVEEPVGSMALSACGRLLVVGGEKAQLTARETGGGGSHRRAPVPALLWLHSLKVRRCAVYDAGKCLLLRGLDRHLHLCVMRIAAAASAQHRAGAQASAALHSAVSQFQKRWFRMLSVRVYCAQKVMRYKWQLLPDEGYVTTLLINRDGCIVAGTSTGSVALLSPDTRRTITPRPNLAECVYDDTC